ncbi:MAG: hypothetical protein IJU11_07360, partial [Prevotella sp.]|nr:hypothetical protein [Prevotella sp.]
QSAGETVSTYKVAVMVEDDDMVHWQSTAKWVLENLEEAQRGMKNKVRLELEFKNQDAADIESYMQQVAEDTTIAAIVGPSASLRAEQMAGRLSETIIRHDGIAAYRKPMISPTASSVEYQRKFAKTDYVWNMAECDINRLEASVSVMSTMLTSQFVEYVVITPDEETVAGQQNTNTEWLNFLAEEYGLTIKAMHTYRNSAELRDILEKNFTGVYSLSGYPVVFTPGSTEDIRVLNDFVEKSIERAWQVDSAVYHPRIFCSENFLSPTTASLLGAENNAIYVGMDIYADPESGFVQAYDQHFGQEILDGEAQFYDALCMVAFGAALAEQTGETLNEALHTLAGGNGGLVRAACFPNGMQTVFEQLQAGRCPAISGACGRWNFKNGSTSMTGTTYRYWRYYKGQFVTAEYVSSAGSRRSTSSEHAWEWTPNNNEQFTDADDVHISYPELNDHWALLVAASKGWGNYRFQADVFAMYHILKKAGYADDHIVLIMEDDLANSADNKYDPGAVRTSETGTNLYAPEAIDYKLNSLTPSDIGDILQGKRSERLPHVIQAGPQDNIFLFWSSHGNPGSLDFGGMETMSYAQMKDMLEQTTRRKMLVAVEACYSGGLGQACTGLPGVLFITAANPYETSHADHWSQKIGVYLSNGFTAGFQKAIEADPSISMNRLYYELARSTSGSHVKVYNIPNYGSIYSSNMGEYLSI